MSPQIGDGSLNTPAYWDTVYGGRGFPALATENVARFQVAANYQAGATALDVGCGQAGLGAILLDRYPGLTYVGLDYSAAAVASHVLPVKAWDRWALLTMPFEAVPAALAGQQFDTVYLCEVLEHVPDPAALLAAVAPLARERLVITVPGHNRLCWEQHRGEHAWDFSEEELRTLLAPYGSISPVWWANQLSRVVAVDRRGRDWVVSPSESGERYLVANLAYGFGSWGDEMILDGVLNTLGRERCVVLTADVAETRAMHQVEVVSEGMVIPDDCQVLYVGGGGWGHEPLATAVLHLAREWMDRGKPVEVHAVGLREEVDWHHHAETFRRVRELTVRDPVSRRIAREHFNRNPPLVFDPSLAMGVTPLPLPDGPWLGLNVAGGDEPLERLLPMVRAFLDRGYKLLGLPTIAHKLETRLDGHADLKTLAAMLGTEVIDVPGPWVGNSVGPRELVGLAQNCRYIVGMRKHGCFLAQRAGVPCLMVDWYADHGLPHRLHQLRTVVAGSMYCDLHAGEDPLAMAEGAGWLPD